MSDQGKLPMTPHGVKVYCRSLHLYGECPTLKGFSWTGDPDKLTSLRFHYSLEGKGSFDGPLYGLAGDGETVEKVDFDFKKGERLLKLTGVYDDVRGIIKSVTFHTESSQKLAGLPGLNGTQLIEIGGDQGEIVDFFGTCHENSISSIGVYKKC